MKKALFVFSLCFLFFYSLNVSIAAEPDYPTKPIEIMVGFQPGGGSDVGARMIAEKSKKYLGQDVVVINKPGGGGGVAWTLISKAKPDGYTLTASSDAPIAYNPLVEKVHYKPFEDFTFIAQYGLLDMGFVVLPDSPFRNFKDAIEFARANPNKLTVGVVGATSLSAKLEILALMANVKIQIVPFPGAAPAVTALLGGHVMIASSGSSGYAMQLKAQKVRLLAVMSEERVYNHPEAPTLKELGYPIVDNLWYVIAGPKNMEKPIAKKLEEAFKKAMESPEFIKLSQDLEIWEKNLLFGDDLKVGCYQRYKKNEEFLKKIGKEIVKQ